MPFWIVTIAMCFGLTFTIVNFANILRWHIRAQNAADSAASAVLAGEGTMNNQISTQFYAMAIDEYRIRMLNQALLNNMAANPPGAPCNSACSQEYATLQTALTSAVSAYNGVIDDMKQANDLTQGGAQRASSSFSAFTSNSQGNFDGAFTYGINDVQADPTSPNQITAEVYSCRKVPILVPGFIGFKGVPAFTAIARSAVVLQPISTTTITPAQFVDANGMPYQATQTIGSTTISFSNLKFQANVYGAMHVKSYTTNFDPIAVGNSAATCTGA